MATSAEANIRLNAQIIIGTVIGATVVTSATWTGGTATLNFASHKFVVGLLVHVSGITPAGYNGDFVVTGATTTTITYTVANPGGVGGAGVANSRVQLGTLDNPATYSFFALLVTDGPFFLILPAENTPWDGQTRHMEITVKGELYFGAAADTSTTFTSAEDTWTAVRNALVRESNWSGRTVKTAPVNKLTVRGPIPRSDLKPMAYLYEFDMSFPGAAGV